MMGGPSPGSASISSMFVATLKKLSARRKNPSFGRRKVFARRMYLCSSECDGRVEKWKFFEPPSALKPHATAIASRRVDLPVPFSPMMNVTLGWNLIFFSSRMAGNEKG
jgi:hypothetical protein